MSINKKIEHRIENVNKTNDERTKTNIICKQSATENVTYDRNSQSTDCRSKQEEGYEKSFY
jgi:hypothetical protein